MPDAHEPEPDVAIVASVTAAELRFLSAPDVQVEFPGTGARDAHQTTERDNVDSPVQPGRTYRQVRVTTRITSRLGPGLAPTDETGPTTRGSAPQ